jgi:hypothetical protein
MGGYADFEAASAAWDAKAQFSNLSGLFGVYGGNPGSLGPGPKPGDMMSFALSGGLGSDARSAGRYPGSSYFWTAGEAMSRGKKGYGAAAYMQNFTPTTLGSFSKDAADHGLKDLANMSVDAVNATHDKLSENGGPIITQSGGQLLQQGQGMVDKAVNEKFPPRK